MFSIATYWDNNNIKFLDSTAINTKTNEKYSYIDKKLKNLHYWDDEYYFLSDEIEQDERSNNFRNRKLNILKKAYDIWASYELSDYEKEINWLRKNMNSSYNSCWLKYALDRNYLELFENIISYDKEIVYINITGSNGYSQSKCNFFARVFSLDKNKENWSVNHYNSWIWDYSGKRVNSLFMEEGIKLQLSNKTINHSKMRILWFSYIEKYLNYELNGKIGKIRCFFYYKLYIHFSEGINSLIAIEDGKVIINEFNNNIFDIYEFNLNNSSIINSIDDKIKGFEEETKMYENFNDIEKSKWTGYKYNYNDEVIYKFGLIDVIMLNIERNRYISREKGSLTFKVLI